MSDNTAPGYLAEEEYCGSVFEKFRFLISNLWVQNRVSTELHIHSEIVYAPGNSLQIRSHNCLCV